MVHIKQIKSVFPSWHIDRLHCAETVCGRRTCIRFIPQVKQIENMNVVLTERQRRHLIGLVCEEPPKDQGALVVAASAKTDDFELNYVESVSHETISHGAQKRTKP